MTLTKITEMLQCYQPRLLAPTTPSAGVILLLLTNAELPLEIVLTERSFTLPTYAGDVSFPGGMQDATDGDLYQTAQRELREELQIQPHTYERIGQLDDFQDRFGYLVRPFVCTMEKSAYLSQLKPEPAEIERVLYLNVADLPNFKNDPVLAHVTRRSPSYSLNFEGALIWGLTAMILVHFFNIIHQEKRPLARIPKR